MDTKTRTLRFAWTSIIVLAAAVGGASADAPPPLPEYGFRGLKRVEIIFVNVGRTGMTGGVAAEKGSAPAELPADDLASHDLAKEPDCQAIGKTLSNAGLEIVERCKPDDLACAQLYLRVENHSSDGSADRIYLVSALLSQRINLARDKKVELSMPSTWLAHRVTVVPANHSATSASCMDLRGLATWFGSSWRISNK